MQRLLPFLLFILLISTERCYGQVTDVLTFRQVDSLQRIEKRPVVVFIHTSWCRYCQSMEHTTFRNEAVKDLLGDKFYFITLDAEEKKDIRINGQTFSYRPTGAGSGQHELAQILGQIDGKVAFPTLCFLNADNEIIYQHTGFLTAKQLEKTLRTINDGI